jgi:DNA-binding NtrC family response regulator
MAAAAVADELVRAPKVEASARRILVVEDDPDTRELACELLAALGHAASGCGSAEHALTLLQEHEVDILFTDLYLPRLSGIELASRAIALRPGLKVILTSGEGNTVRVPSGSGIIVLPKPYDLLQLEQRIAEATLETGETLQ